MTLKEAKAVRDFIKGRRLACNVPLGNGPNGYYARTWGAGKNEFRSMSQARKFFADRIRKKRKETRGRGRAVMYPMWRVCVETLLPGGMRVGLGMDRAIHQQFPVSDWLELGDCFRLLEMLRAMKPLTDRGLLYGHQERHEERRPGWHEAELTRIKEGGLPYILAAAEAKREKEREAFRRVDEFLASFPDLKYRVVHGLDAMAQAATEGRCGDER